MINSQCMNASELRHDWDAGEIESIYSLPLPELIFQAQVRHRKYHNPDEVQGCVLLSVKTGGCPEDCAYCPQSARYDTGVEATALLSVAETLRAATHAKEQGATRFCMGAAWRDIPEGRALRSGPGDGARSSGSRYGSLLHARHALAGTS